MRVTVSLQLRYCRVTTSGTAQAIPLSRGAFHTTSAHIGPHFRISLVFHAFTAFRTDFVCGGGHYLPLVPMLSRQYRAPYARWSLVITTQLLGSLVAPAPARRAGQWRGSCSAISRHAVSSWPSPELDPPIVPAQLIGYDCGLCRRRRSAALGSLHHRAEVSVAGLRSRRFLSDSDSDSGLKISTPTPTPTPLRLRPNKRHSILKRAI